MTQHLLSHAETGMSDEHDEIEIEDVADNHDDLDHNPIGFMGRLNRLWKRLPSNFRWNLEDSFQPEDMKERLLPGEVVQLEIHIAQYRDIVGWLVFDHFGLIFGITIISSALTLIYGLLSGFNLYYGFIPPALLIVFSVIGIKERIEHQQWRLVKTNARLIISIPQHNAFPLVDNIELKGMPSVMDTNWSKNPLWRVFQFATGARDVYLSLAAYRFVEGTAKVGDALVLPDIMPKDILELRKLIFKPFAPQPVRFLSPQKVIQTEEDG